MTNERETELMDMLDNSARDARSIGLVLLQMAHEMSRAADELSRIADTQEEAYK